MKKKLLIFSVVALMSSAFGYSQKVKIKKGIAYVDKVEYLKLDDCGGFSTTCTLMTLENEDFLSMQFESYQKPNPVPRNPKSKAPYRSTVKVSYVIAKFLDFDLDFESSLNKKKLIKALFKSKVIDENGQVNQENAKKFVRKYGERISVNRPTVIMTN